MTRYDVCTLSDALKELLVTQGLDAMPKLIRRIVNAAM